jgi:hypothetical protein
MTYADCARICAAMNAKNGDAQHALGAAVEDDVSSTRSRCRRHTPHTACSTRTCHTSRYRTWNGRIPGSSIQIPWPTATRRITPASASATRRWTAGGLVRRSVPLWSRLRDSVAGHRAGAGRRMTPRGGHGLVLLSARGIAGDPAMPSAREDTARDTVNQRTVVNWLGLVSTSCATAPSPVTTRRRACSRGSGAAR